MSKPLNERPYAEWLEETLQFISEEDPSKIIVVCRCGDGNVGTKYYNCDMEDLATLSQYVMTDMIMKTVLNNAPLLKRRLEALEALEEGEDNDMEL